MSMRGRATFANLIMRWNAGVLLSPGPAVRAADLGLRAQPAGGAAKLEEMRSRRS